jgi:hypothetical protein
MIDNRPYVSSYYCGGAKLTVERCQGNIPSNRVLPCERSSQLDSIVTTEAVIPCQGFRTRHECLRYRNSREVWPQEALFEFGQRGEVVWREDLSLNDGEVDLDLIAPASVNRRVDEDGVGVPYRGVRPGNSRKQGRHARSGA